MLLLYPCSYSKILYTKKEKKKIGAAKGAPLQLLLFCTNLYSRREVSDS